MGEGTPDRMVCTACGATTPIERVPSTCPECDGILDLFLGEKAGDARAPSPAGASEGLWVWADHLPHCKPQNRITLGEGNSPLLAAPRLGKALGVDDLWIKNDSLQPSGSFKDRAVALATSLACEYGRDAMVLSSSGNAGASSAAYAARAGLPLFVLVPKTAPPAKLRQIVVAGAHLVTVDGQTHDCCRLAKEAAETMGWVNLTTTYHNPYGVDAYATIAYELAALKPDVLLLPISSGPLLGGMMKGFERLKRLGLVDRIPRPIAVQTAACAPIVAAYRSGGAVEPWAHQHTIASALNDTLAGYERDGDYTLSFIRRHGGAAVAVDDQAIVEAVRLTAACEGVVLEPSAAVPIAALRHARDALGITGDERIVAVTTGHGLKDLSTVEEAALPTPIAPEFGALEPLLKRTY
ncbi:threonine synthase [Acuticoccus kandeliae]|uniref:threonine synthase n=1 Tax=Acuticoccus kandeliae TaxID=2073160 RepID=UPI0014728B0C|nr:threonine synthase [Acuticoccus kandeliae]